MVRFPGIAQSRIRSAGSDVLFGFLKPDVRVHRPKVFDKLRLRCENPSLDVLLERGVTNVSRSDQYLFIDDEEFGMRFWVQPDVNTLTGQFLEATKIIERFLITSVSAVNACLQCCQDMTRPFNRPAARTNAASTFV